VRNYTCVATIQSELATSEDSASTSPPRTIAGTEAGTEADNQGSLTDANATEVTSYNLYKSTIMASTAASHQHPNQPTTALWSNSENTQDNEPSVTNAPLLVKTTSSPTSYDLYKTTDMGSTAASHQHTSQTTLLWSNSVYTQDNEPTVTNPPSLGQTTASPSIIRTKLQWHSWMEWSACFRSSTGGVKTRFQLCDAPSSTCTHNLSSYLNSRHIKLCKSASIELEQVNNFLIAYDDRLRESSSIVSATHGANLVSMATMVAML
jgi:hypothetical protein